jgi:dienelactone hydrolase
VAAFAVLAVACGGSSAEPGDAATPQIPAVTFFDVSGSSPVAVTQMLWADALDIRVTGLAPLAQATVTARFTGWGASATFAADENGGVDLATSAPLSGSYAGADADGIVWSMTPSTSPDDPKDDPFALRLSVDVDGATVATGQLERLAVTGDVTCRDVTDGGLVGYYCAKSGAPRGAIVTFGGSEGGLSSGKSQAMYFASLGYPSLGLAYFGAKGLPSTLDEVPLEYFSTAFDWVAAQPEVAPGKLAVVGGSRGGELALLLGATFSNVTAVVAELPSGIVWPGWSDWAIAPAWTYQGQPIAYLPSSSMAESNVTEPDGVVAMSERAAFVADIAAASPADLDAATTRVEKTNGPILMFGGASDELWPSCDLAGYAKTRLDAAGHTSKYGDTLVCYPDAGHDVYAFNVGVPTTSAMHVLDGTSQLALGGTAAGISHAARDADDRERAFFAANL